MKRTIIISMGLIAGFSMSVFAQGNEKKERKEKCDFACEQMVKDLNLSDEQAAQLKVANENFFQEAKGIRENKQKAMKADRAAMKAAKARRDSAIKAALTQEQYIKLLEGKVQRLEHRPDMKKGNRFSGKPTHLKKEDCHRHHRGDTLPPTRIHLEKRR